jgi:hypothetical protein
MMVADETASELNKPRMSIHAFAYCNRRIAAKRGPQCLVAVHHGIVTLLMRIRNIGATLPICSTVCR